jgi:ankyrin repeat protein
MHPLQWAVRWKQPYVAVWIKLLVEKNHHGAEYIRYINFWDHNENTALSWAVRAGDMDAVQTLLDPSYGLDLSRQKSEAPLKMVVRRGFAEIAAIIREREEKHDNQFILTDELRYEFAD